MTTKALDSKLGDSKLKLSQQATPVGLVSQAFRKSDKYTEATMMRVNPQLAF